MLFLAISPNHRNNTKGIKHRKTKWTKHLKLCHWESFVVDSFFHIILLYGRNNWNTNTYMEKSTRQYHSIWFVFFCVSYMMPTIEYKVIASENPFALFFVYHLVCIFYHYYYYYYYSMSTTVTVFYILVSIVVGLPYFCWAIN